MIADKLTGEQGMLLFTRGAACVGASKHMDTGTHTRAAVSCTWMWRYRAHQHKASCRKGLQVLLQVKGLQQHKVEQRRGLLAVGSHVHAFLPLTVSPCATTIGK